ncbi:MAG: repeat protein [Fibrobacteres bacterium]|nr:repeat protein [Fibrobacterota bacterium]
MGLTQGRSRRRSQSPGRFLRIPILFAQFLILALAFSYIGCTRSADSSNPTAPAEPQPGDTLTPGEPGPSGYAELILDSINLPKPWGKALGDIDGDGKPDALVGTLDGPIYWYRAPGWEKAVLIPEHGGDDLQVADLDGDGRLDVVTNGGVIAWYHNPGGDLAPGAWQEHILYASKGSHDLAIADIDRDGKPDVASRIENGPTLIFFQDGKDHWLTRELHAANGGTGLALGDIDGDGRADVAESGYWLKQPENPRDGEWERHEIVPWDRTSAVAIADMNRDGKGDVFLSVGHGNGRLSWFQAPADPERDGWKEHFIDKAGFVHRFHVVDLDGDKDLDLVFAEQDEVPGSRVGIFLNRDGAGTSWKYRGISHEGSHNIAIADIGPDGDWDILGADWRGDTRPRLWIKVK